MAIISVSLSPRMLEELDRIRAEMGFSGRSEAIRAALRMLIGDAKEKGAIRGRVKGILLLIHEHEAEGFVCDVKHSFLDIIHTQLHNRFEEGKCLELFVLDGEADRVRDFAGIFQRNEGIDHMKLIII
ncbi:MAG: CopG family ribbon-helix-helix protein [Candidatus Bathyarchaeia archaeon]